jgi:hypothetical protein
VVATGGANNFYPGLLPRRQWIVFCRAPGGVSGNNPGARIMLMPSTGAGGPVDLGRANQGAGNLYNAWPRWAPSMQQGRYWLLFSSRRPYPPLNGTGPQQLWVTQLDTSLWPAIPPARHLLPGQEPFTGNLTGEWSATQ